MLTSLIAHGSRLDTMRESALKVDSRRRIFGCNGGNKPTSVLRLAFQSVSLALSRPVDSYLVDHKDAGRLIQDVTVGCMLKIRHACQLSFALVALLLLFSQRRWGWGEIVGDVQHFIRCSTFSWTLYLLPNRFT